MYSASIRRAAGVPGANSRGSRRRMLREPARRHNRRQALRARARQHHRLRLRPQGQRRRPLRLGDSRRARWCPARLLGIHRRSHRPVREQERRCRVLALRRHRRVQRLRPVPARWCPARLLRMRRRSHRPVRERERRSRIRALRRHRRVRRPRPAPARWCPARLLRIRRRSHRPVRERERRSRIRALRRHRRLRPARPRPRLWLLLQRQPCLHRPYVRRAAWERPRPRPGPSAPATVLSHRRAQPCVSLTRRLRPRRFRSHRRPRPNRHWRHRRRCVPRVNPRRAALRSKPRVGRP